MKNYLFSYLLVYFSFIPFCLNAQSSQLKFEPGIHAGINISALSDMDHDYEPIAGFLAGFSLEGGYSGRPFTVESGLNYIRNGAKRRVQGVNSDFITDYLSLPVMVKYYFNNYRLSGVNLFAGPKLNYLLRSEVIFNMGEDTVKNDYIDQTTNMLYLVQAGAGSKVDKGGLNFTLKLQFSISINEVYDGEELRRGQVRNISLVGGLIF